MKQTRLHTDANPGFRKTLQYRLTYQEAYDTFYLMAFRQSRRTRLLLGICLTAAAVLLLVLFARDSRTVYNLFLAIIATLLLFYLIYHPALAARRGAAKVARTNGTYRITIHGSGRIDLPGNQTIQFGEEKYARAAETDTIFALRPDTQNTLCIPKRLLSETEAAEIRKILGLPNRQTGT